MKKTLVTLLALVFVLSVAGAAFAAPANPFVDVPAKHWAYGAVAKLAKAGIIDGYGDGTFRGDKLMSRYEFAQATAKAMAKSDKADAELKALIDKLAVEFAAELNNLGVRVAKLEAKTAIGWTFESRIRWMGDDNKTSTGTNAFDWRQRIYLSGAVNDKVDYGARLEASNAKFGTNANTVAFNRAFFNIKDLAGIDSIVIGRFGTYGLTNALMNGKTSNNDGVIITEKLGDTVTAKLMVSDQGANQEYNLLDLQWQATKDLKLNVAYSDYSMALAGNQTNVGLVYKIGDITLTGEYVSNKITGTSPKAKAYAFQITNGNGALFFPSVNLVNQFKPHTDAFMISYRSVEMNATPVMSGFAGTAPASSISDSDNVKGCYFAYQNVLSKGLVWTVEYQDLKQKVGSSKDKSWTSYFTFYF